MTNYAGMKPDNLRKRMKLLTLANPKLVKGEKMGWLTAVLHLAPSDLSGFNVCPMAKRVAEPSAKSAALSSCSTGCLNLAGRGGLAPGGALSVSALLQGRSNTIQAARIRKTKWLFADRVGFLCALYADIWQLVAWCEVNGYKPAVRLNGTSDLDWGGMTATNEGKSIFDYWPQVQFYDYTKVYNRLKPSKASRNYRVVYSYNETEASGTVARNTLLMGGNVAVVFSTRKGQPLPATWQGFPVIDGDETDLRHLDPPGTVVGLRAKGPARKDVSGFVVRV